MASAGSAQKGTTVNIQLAWGGKDHQLILAVTPGFTPRSDRPVGDGPFSGVVPDATTRPPRTKPGQPFGSENNASWAGYRRFTLEDGSRVVSDAAALDTAVLQLTDDPREVLTSYATQLATPDDQPAPVTVERLPNGDTTLSFTYAPEGGGGATFVTDPSKTFAKVTYASD